MNEHLPFTTDVNDFDYASGLVVFKDDQLFLQLEIKDGFTDELKSDLLEITISVNQIDKVVLKSNYFRGKLQIYFNDLKAAQLVPGYQNNLVRLKFSKKNALQAKKIAADIQLRLSEIQLLNAQKNQSDS